MYGFLLSIFSGAISGVTQHPEIKPSIMRGISTSGWLPWTCANGTSFISQQRVLACFSHGFTANQSTERAMAEKSHSIQLFLMPGHTPHA